jgi:peptide/nickel transport system substrate-binding protein
MVDALGYGFYVANNQILPPNNPGHTQGLGTRDYNPDKARELLADAGLENGFTVDIVVMNTYQDGGIMLEQYYRDVGITVNLIVVESAGYWDYIMGGWEGIIFGGYGLPLDIASFVLNYFPPIASFNVSTEIPDDIRELAEAYITEKDDDRAKEINDEINQMIFDRCLFVTTYSNAVGYVLYPYVKGGGFMEYVDFKPWDPADIWMDK